MLQARWQVFQWQKGKSAMPGLAEWGVVRNDFASALKVTPGDPHIYENLGYLYGMRVASSKAFPELEVAMLDQAIIYYRESLTYRPMSPFAWANLALALHLKKSDVSLMWDAYDHAFKYGQREGGVQRTLSEIGFARWDTIDQNRKDALMTLVENAPESSRNDLVKIAARYGKKIEQKQ